MMNNVSHQARWQYIPLAAPKLTPWQRIWRFLDELFAPMMVPEALPHYFPPGGKELTA